MDDRTNGAPANSHSRRETSAKRGVYRGSNAKTKKKRRPKTPFPRKRALLAFWALFTENRDSFRELVVFYQLPSHGMSIGAGSRPLKGNLKWPEGFA